MANDNTLNVEITSSVDGLKKGLVQADKGLKKFDTETKKVTSSNKKMTGGMVKGTIPAMTSFSQVVQDAPFGIRGVANNIQQLTMQMGHLSSNAGGTKNALKAMVGSLIGPAGILLAVSLVTSLLVSYGDEIGNFIKGTDNAKKAIKEFDAELENLGKTLSRLKIAKKLSEALGKDTAKISLKTLQLLKDQQEIQEGQVANALKLFKDYEKEAKSFGLFSSSKISKKEHAELKKLSADYDGFVASVKKTKLAIQDLEEELSKGGEVTIGGDDDKKDKKFNVTAELVAREQALEKEFKQEQVYFQKNQDALNQYLADKEQAEIDAEDTRLENQIQASLRAQAELERFNQNIRGIIEGGIANSFSMIGDAIGNAFATGTDVIKAAGNALAQGFADILGVMGDYLIKAGAAAVVAATITKTFGTIAGIGAGIAAIAAGTALKALSGGISSKIDSAAGGSGSSHSSGGSNNNFRGSSSSYGSGSSGGTYVFEIAGTKLVGVLKNTLDRNRALGGSLGFTS